jgi:hypothetical protein
MNSAYEGDAVSIGLSNPGALFLNTTGSVNTAIGRYALAQNCCDVSSGCTAHDNTGVGNEVGLTNNAANGNVSGASYTFLGARSGRAQNANRNLRHMPIGIRA